jgi:hypothetical protein
LSADETPSVLEGTWNRDKVVLMSFPDELAFQAWANSPDYLDIAKDRKAGAEAVVLLAKGFSPQRVLNARGTDHQGSPHQGSPHQGSQP